MIEEWIDNISEVDPDTGLPACPYAKPAWNAGRVQEVRSVDGLWPTVLARLPEFLASNGVDVIVVVDTDYRGPYEDLEQAADGLNEFFSEAGVNCWVLSHLSDEAVIFIQRLTDLDNSAAQLEKLGYYQTYTQRDYDRLIAHRRTRRLHYDARQEG